MLEKAVLAREDGAGNTREQPAIRASGLAFAYPASKESVVRGLDFTVARGETFGFLPIPSFLAMKHTFAPARWRRRMSLHCSTRRSWRLAAASSLRTRQLPGRT